MSERGATSGARGTPGAPARWVELAEAEHGGGDRGERSSSELAAAARLVAGARRIEPPLPGSRARTFARIRATTELRAADRRILGWAAAGALAGALVVFALVRPAQGPSGSAEIVAELAAVEGTVQAGERAEIMSPAGAGRRVRSGARVKTNGGSSSTLVLSSGGTIVLAADTEVSLAHAAGEVGLVLSEPERLELALHAGRVSISVGPTPPARPVAITAGTWTIRPITLARSITAPVASGVMEGPAGEVEISREGPDEVVVAVASGAVDVDGPRVHARVGAGERFDSRAALVAPPRAEPTPGASEASAPIQGVEPEVGEGAARAEVEPAGRTSIRARVREALRPRAAPAEAARGSRGDGAGAGSSSVPVPPEPAPGEPEVGPAELYAMAQREGDPLRAIALFDRVVAARHPLSEVAEHQAARIAMRIGKCTDAVARFERALAGRPDGAYAQEARLDVLECHIRLGSLDGAERDLELFLARHPTSERSLELRFLKAELARGRGKHLAALADYRAAFGSRRDEDARYFAGWCELELGDESAAAATLEGYLERYPSGRHAAHAREALAGLARRKK